MARKSSDLMSLLAARGRSRGRGRSGFVQQVQAVFGSALATVWPRGGRGGGHVARGAARANGSLALAGGAFVLVGIGYLLGSVFPWGALAGERGGAGLQMDGTRRAPEGLEPGVIHDDMKALSLDYLLTVAYVEKAAAMAAARNLRQQGLERARVREVEISGRKAFGLVVYVDGRTDRDAAEQLLRVVTPPDTSFAETREGAEAKGRDWPVFLSDRAR